MKTFKAMFETEEARRKAELAEIKRHKRIWGIAKKHAAAFKKSLGKTNMTVSLSYHEYGPSVDINIHLGADNSISDIYPLVDAMIKDPRLNMVKPLPSMLEDTDTFHCDFEENTKKKIKPITRIYVWITSSKVCVAVGTGKYKEITRVVCGHYEDGVFVEDK